MLLPLVLVFNSLVYAYASKAQGNLAVVIKSEGRLYSTDDEPLEAYAPDLWCQAADGDEIQSLAWARFIRVNDRKEYEARIDEDLHKARLSLGYGPVSNAGKFRCEMRTQEGNMLYGNMFIYTRPYVYSNGSFDVAMSETDPLTVVTSTVSKLTAGQPGFIHCPIKGYPEVDVEWTKDGQPLDENDGVNGNVIEIENVDSTHEGLYECVGSSEFAMVVDGAVQKHQVRFQQQVQLGGGWDWVLPLTVILIILILLFLIIYTCQACKRYRAQNYNVARQERNNQQRPEQQTLKGNAV